VKWNDKAIGALMAIGVTAWAVLIGLALFGVIGTHEARSAGTVLGWVTVGGAGLVALLTQF
jgi:hypothetical protein